MDKLKYVAPIITIRIANELDAREIAKIHIASWQKIYRGHIPDNILDNLSVSEREKIWQELINKNITLLVLEKNRKMVGFASINPSRDTDSNPSTCGEISAIYLHPDVWRQGLGKLLCKRALDELQKMGFKEVILWVLNENNQARQFYENMGFTNTEFTKPDTFEEGVILYETRYHKIINL